MRPLLTAAITFWVATEFIIAAPPTVTYPSSATVDQTDEYFGRSVADPYRWLEDVESGQTADWVAAQNEATRGYLDSLPRRAKLRDRLESLWNYERTDLPRRRGDRLFLTQNDGLQNQSVLYTAPADVDPGQLADDREVLIDPNELSEDGTVSMAAWTPSDDGHLVGYAIADGGSDWRTWRVRDVETGTDRDDVIRWVKFSGIAWNGDGTAFYYARYAEPAEGQEMTGTNENQMLYRHTLGTDQAEDALVFARPDEPKWGFSPTVTEDDRYLIITNWRSTEAKSQIFVQDLQEADAPVRALITGFDADYQFVASVGSIFYFLTDHEAPRRRVIAVDVADHLADDAVEPMTPVKRDRWAAVIDQTDDVLEDVSLFGETFYANYLADARSRVLRYEISGKIKDELKVPGIGSVSGLHGFADATETFFTFTNYVTPPSIYRVDLTDDTVTRWLSPEVAFDLDAYVTEQIFVTSPDGTKVPVIITRSVDAVADGSHPTMLYAYGGFNISLTPSYSPAIAGWLDAGGIYAVANLRGGGEYGRSWHEAGMRLQKQNVFDDFIAAAEGLIDAGWTTPSRLAIRGGSNGGLLVGAVMTQRPELFGVALPAVGVMDMLRYHQFTIGWAWVGEYGSSEEEDQIDNLLSYSPLHNLKSGTCYPATMVTTADRDDRVVPGHSFKFAAALQAAQDCDRPTLIRIETRAGHGAGTPTSKRIDEYADLWAFALANLQGG